MSSKLEKPSIDPMLAYVAPMAVFMVLTAAEAWEPIAPYYPWVYAAKIFVTAAVWFFLRRQYPPVSAVGLPLGIVVGLIGFGVWIGLSKLDLEAPLRAWMPEWLAGGKRASFDPFASIDPPAAAWLFVGIRMLGLCVVVPLVEEVFWRGFILRFLISPDFETVPIGKLTAASFAVTSILFALVHPELLAALVWSSMINLLAWRTGNLWSCIAAHTVTNFALGVYILAVRDWALW